jgi:hypothetical protein
LMRCQSRAATAPTTKQPSFSDNQPIRPSIRPQASKTASQPPSSQASTWAPRYTVLVGCAGAAAVSIGAAALILRASSSTAAAASRCRPTSSAWGKEMPGWQVRGALGKGGQGQASGQAGRHLPTWLQPLAVDYSDRPKLGFSCTTRKRSQRIEEHSGEENIQRSCACKELPMPPTISWRPAALARCTTHQDVIPGVSNRALGRRGLKP